MHAQHNSTNNNVVLLAESEQGILLQERVELDLGHE